jgi:hypothetical protein
MPSPVGPPRICEQTAITTTPEDGAHEGIEHAGNRRVRGIAAQTLLLAFQLAHANVRKVNAWLATLPGPDGPPPKSPPKTPKPLGTWTPTGHIDPPAA